MGMDREAEAGGRSLRTPADREGGRRLSLRVGAAQNERVQNGYGTERVRVGPTASFHAASQLHSTQSQDS